MRTMATQLTLTWEQWQRSSLQHVLNVLNETAIDTSTCTKWNGYRTDIFFPQDSPIYRGDDGRAWAREVGCLGHVYRWRHCVWLQVKCVCVCVRVCNVCMWESVWVCVFLKRILETAVLSFVCSRYIYICCIGHVSHWRHCVWLHVQTHCNTLQHSVTHSNTLQHTATQCNTLQHTATHCNTV